MMSARGSASQNDPRHRVEARRRSIAKSTDRDFGARDC